MKLIVVRIIATILFSIAVLNYMSSNSTFYKRFVSKEFKINNQPQ